MIIDLHTHTTASDGVLKPAELVRRAESHGVTLLSVTDHDTFGAYPELDKNNNIQIIPGIELTMSDMHGLHLLAYGFAADTPLHFQAKRLAALRLDRAKEMLRRLETLGLRLDTEKLLAGGGSIGRPHLARALVQAGYAHTVPEAFDRWLSPGRPCYVQGERLSIKNALSLVRESGFVPVLAHPCELKIDYSNLRSLVNAWISQGLMGIEVYHPTSVQLGYETLRRLAKDYGLFITGGSDFHAPDGGCEPGCTARFWPDVESDAIALTEAIKSIQAKSLH